ncbi:LysR substrate-binding domain-containing protein, partial [Bacillus cereus]|nr:LysR substrate-binding domain-containing protein [Bacillus cereus]
GYESPFIDMFRQAGATLHAAFTVYNMNTSVNMIREGLGLAILSEMSMAGMPLQEPVVTRDMDPQVDPDVQLALPSLTQA